MPWNLFLSPNFSNCFVWCPATTNNAFHLRAQRAAEGVFVRFGLVKRSYRVRATLSGVAVPQNSLKS